MPEIQQRRRRKGWCGTMAAMMGMMWVATMGGARTVMAQSTSSSESESENSTPADIFYATDVSDDLICRQAYHQSTILDNKLYIVGGLIKYRSVSLTVPNTYLRTLDLTKPFLLTDNTTNPYTVTPLPSDVPAISSGVLWGDETTNTLRLLPGTASLDMTFERESLRESLYPEPKMDEMWTYDTVKGSWNSEKAKLPEGGAFAKDQANVWVPELRKGFMMGGAHGESDDLESLRDVVQGNLVTWDAEKETWKNETTNSPTPKYGGGLVYLEGLEALVAIGWMTTGGKRTSEKINSVDVYSIAQKKWYQQKTTGERPFLRGSFCTVVAAAPDKSSYNIYVYGGGTRGTDGAAQLFGTTHILTLPSFQWITANADQWSKNRLATGENDKMTCHTLDGGRQMLVVGGRPKTPLHKSGCMETRGHLNLFDLTTLSWESSYTPGEKKYLVPGLVVDAIGGNHEGGATAKEPTGGFTDPELASVFDPPSPTPTPSSSTSSSTPMSNSTPASASTSISTSTSTSLPVGAIVGGALGGAAGVIAIVLLIWFYRRQHRSSHKPHSTAMELEAGMDGSQKPLTSSGSSYHDVPTELMDKQVPVEMMYTPVTVTELPGNQPLQEMQHREPMELPGDEVVYLGDRPTTVVSAQSVSEWDTQRNMSPASARTADEGRYADTPISELSSAAAATTQATAPGPNGTWQR